jgi:hypothetical protein
MSDKKVFAGEVIQTAGVASLVAGFVMSLHYWPAFTALLAGGVAFFLGKKLRGMP